MICRKQDFNVAGSIDIMWYIILGIILLGIIAGLLGYVNNRRRQHLFERGEIDRIDEPETLDEDCCGQHEVCERDSLWAAVSKEIEYYDDEELDMYRGIPSDGYTEKVVNEFREVLYTLREIEVAGWVRSLQLRDIHLPDALKDEAFLIIGERRMHQDRKIVENVNKH